MNASMKRIVWMISAGSLATALGTASAAPPQYPETRKVDQADDYHGTSVSDPYRWLEDLDSDETAAWVKDQNAVTFAYLAKIPYREAITKRLTELWNYEKFGVPEKVGDRYAYSRNDGLQNQSVLYIADTLDGAPRELLDPNKLSSAGTVALSGAEFSNNGKLLLYGLSKAGSDWVELFVRDVAAASDLSDHLEWVKFTGLSWAPDDSGFYYSRYDAPQEGENALESANYYHKLYFHKLGTPQSEDKLVYERPDEKEWGFGGQVTDDGTALVITSWVGTDQKNRVFIQTPPGGDAPVQPLLADFDAEYTFIDNDGPVFWFWTDKDAPRGRIVAVDVRQPQAEHWKELIPQGAETIQGVDVVGDRFVVNYLKDAYTVVRIFQLDGKFEREVEFPEIGAAAGFAGKRTATETFYSFESYTRPPTIYRYDLKSNTSTVFRKPEVKFNPDEYQTKQDFYTSKDGVKIPIFVVSRGEPKLDGNAPTMLYGYGGFNIALTPRFSVANLLWMELGGVYAVANIRGGGEYGKEWHDAGRRANKQNVFDDFIAAGEWLIKSRYTQPARLAIRGGSNGGLLVGACMTQRPDLFGVALPAVGVLDMLRFHKFTIGWAWVSDYGSSDNAEDFRIQYAYSPLHNLKPGTRYPSTLITTGDHDDRVVPSHSFKFASALQAAHKGDNPVLIRIETDAGHGAGKPTSKIIEEAADVMSFTFYEMRVDLPRVEGSPLMSSQ